MKLRAHWLDDPATVAVMEALERGGARAWFVGGCVRDGLLGREAGDIDIATDVVPGRVAEIAEGAGLRSVPTGEDHGTVTLVADHRPFEVTTLRRDVSTDGRRATVAYTDRLEEDAHRRDFTINALYASRDGTVLDPTGEGRDDLAARRVRFIGDPHDRIREDYLRILRFFRFHAWYADPDGGLDAAGLAASAEMAEGLSRLSRERVGAEMLKLLAAPDPAPAVAAMEASGVLARLLPGADARLLPVLVALEEDLAPDPIRRLAALGGENLADRLRLSRAQGRRLELLREGMGMGTGAGELGYRHGADMARDIVLLRAAAFGQAPDADALAEARAGADAVFPLRAADLLPDFQGPALGAELDRLERAWIASGFTLTAAELLS
ncbi:CCA tRNA nucleotidyltransferase [Roseibacterium sp. SDUM158016]|uniref:CCA tRNA nucleotidyltransferase n=1 Tax=Roseicyclus sediminis TaxID=2980997 RepID=UPI0021D1EC80|nr:CCA tRNA nucleotidyltransferase [Roseibacterium sp. SDUM158016]MCU4652386.1 CCA tRNA nucleotidyltransferase [Roseibacterium sp. SDUM158016]